MLWNLKPLLAVSLQCSYFFLRDRLVLFTITPLYQVCFNKYLITSKENYKKASAKVQFFVECRAKKPDYKLLAGFKSVILTLKKNCG